MAKGAANELSLGRLHSKLTDVFLRVLERYEQRLQVGLELDLTNIEDEMLQELFNENTMPNPAMLSAVSKFLKDNEISFDTEKLNELSSLERRLDELKKKRGNVASITSLPRVVNE